MSAERTEVTIATVTIRSTKSREVARFWRDLLGYQVSPNHTDSILLTGDGPAILIQPSAGESASEADGSAASPIHLDLRPDDHDSAVSRALELGATRTAIGQTGGEGWTVLADPGGNPFCILESADSHEARRKHNPGTPTTIN